MRHRYAGWTGSSSLDWVAEDRRNTGRRGISTVGLFRGRGHCMRGVYPLGGVGLIPWTGWLGIVTIREGVGSAQLVYFGGLGHRLRGVDSLGGVGLIAWIGWLGIGAFTGGRGIGAVDSVV